MSFNVVYVPVGANTYVLDTMQAKMNNSAELLRSIYPETAVPGQMLLTNDVLQEWLDSANPDLIIYQNLAFANATYITEIIRRFSCPVIIWSLREPVSYGGRLELNSLTGAFTAAHTIRNTDNRPYEYVFGGPDEPDVKNSLIAFLEAAKVRKEMKTLRIASVGQSPTGFGFCRALDSELLQHFGVILETAEVRELIEKARHYSAEEVEEYKKIAAQATCGLDSAESKNVEDFVRQYRAYDEYVKENKIGAVASRCWPECFSYYGTPTCPVLSMLNTTGIPAACEDDVYGALSMWIGVQLSGEPSFFGDPIALNEENNTITYWHCGMGACSLARKDTGAQIGLHPNRFVGPVMDFACEPCDGATVFRIGREPDGSFRFFIAEGTGPDIAKQYIGTSFAVKTDNPCKGIIEKAVMDGFEPHFAVMRGRHGKTLEVLAHMLGCKIYNY